MTSKIRTVFDAGQARRDEAALSEHRAMVAQNNLNIERAKLALFPEIGILNRNGKAIFYAYIGGRSQEHYRESTEIDVLSRLIDPRRIVRQNA